MTEWFDRSASQIQGTSAWAGLCAAGGSKRLGQEGFDLGGGGAAPLQEVASLGEEGGRAWRRRYGVRRRDGGECGFALLVVLSILDGTSGTMADIVQGDGFALNGKKDNDPQKS